MLHYIKYILMSLLLAFSCFTTVAAQEQVEKSLQDEVPENTLKSSAAAREIIHIIVNSVGLKPNFEIREANISNAAAVSYKGRRFILYDAKFIERIQKASKTDWAGVSILAHEIGHHLNGHTLLGKESKEPALELEADEFSGFIMRQMGASLEDALKAMKLISNEKGSATHPPRKARLAAIERGYIAANERILAYASQPLEEMVAAYQFEEEKKEEQTSKSAALALADDKIYKNVYLHKFPKRSFYLTEQLKLMVLTEKGSAEIGHLGKSNGKLVLNLYGKKRDSRLYISTKGNLLDANRRVVGYIRNPA